jgi:hypothetical protein
LLPRALLLARRLDDEHQASRFLDPFTVEAVTPADAPGLLAVVERYGVGWFEHQLETWMAHRHRYAPTQQTLPTRAEWVELLPQISSRLLADEHAAVELRVDVARSLTNGAWSWLRTEIERAPQISRPSERHAAIRALGTPLLSVMRAAGAVDADGLHATIIETVCDAAGDLSPMLLGAIDASTRLAPAQLAKVDLWPMAQHCAATMHRELARPERAVGDWSITGFGRQDCCNDCAKFTAFLANPAEQKLVWPLAQPRRQHIHQRIDDAELPVTHQTRREGSPHKLVLTKTSKLFTTEVDNRARTTAAIGFVERFLNQETDRPKR